MLRPGPVYVVSSEFKRGFYPQGYTPSDGEEITSVPDSQSSFGLFFKKFVETKYQIMPTTPVNLKYLCKQMDVSGSMPWKEIFFDFHTDILFRVALRRIKSKKRDLRVPVL